MSRDFTNYKVEGFRKAFKEADLLNNLKKILYIFILLPLFSFSQTTQSILFSNGISEEVIGETYFDLQTNNSIQNRLFVHEDGTISATWTMSPDQLAGFPNRGTGYNYFDGESWMAMPTSRIEAGRTGWPSISGLNGGEILASHVFDDPNLFTTIATRPEKGSGGWSESLLPNSDAVAYDNVWPRMKVGGADGQSIHVISHTYGLENNYITYSRSQNAGESFDIIDYLIPEIGPEFYNGFDGDQYALDVKGETIAIVIGGAWTDVVLVKSTDNGTTWTKTIVKEHPIPFWTDSILVDSASFPEFEGIIESSDQSFSISLDTSGNAHIFYGLMNYSNDVANDDSWSYYPSTDGLVYWNELTQTEVVIASVADLNGNEILDTQLDEGSNAIAYYGKSLTSYPSSAIADNGDIYLIYSSIIEEFYQEQIDLGNYNGENFLQLYRHQYIMRSQDGGATWSTPYDLMTETTNPLTGNPLQEGVFGCISNIVNDNVYLTYQRDMYPGLNVAGDEDPISTNSIVFMTVPIESFENGAFLENGFGCTSAWANNYNSEAITDDGSCELTACPYPNFFEYDTNYTVADVNLCLTLIVEGCTNESAENYTTEANLDDGSCVIYGCMNLEADNFNSEATLQDDSCIWFGCTNEIAVNFDEQANQNDGSCLIYGCLLSVFPNYNPEATIDDLSCSFDGLELFGCTDQTALNYYAQANVDNGTCMYEDITVDCAYSIQEEQIPLFLPEGWSIFGFTCMEPMDAMSAFESIVDRVVIVKDGEGNAYLPEWNFNGIGDLIYSRGYQIKTTEEVLDFSFCSIITVSEESIIPQYQIGDLVQGGIVFYIDETGEHGLVAAMEDFEGTYFGGCSTEEIVGADSVQIGTGYQNTLDIVAGCSETPIAASEALAYESGGYSDWYLPSIGEFVEMYAAIANGGSFQSNSSNYYGSSSEGDADSWWLFHDGGADIGGGSNKQNPFYVRVIRSF